MNSEGRVAKKVDEMEMSDHAEMIRRTSTGTSLATDILIDLKT